jgi:alpha-tubulin suppressor-like RCC1 family protein
MTESRLDILPDELLTGDMTDSMPAKTIAVLAKTNHHLRSILKHVAGKRFLKEMGIQNICPTLDKSFFITNNGRVLVSGSNSDGGFGLGDYKKRVFPTLLPMLLDVKQILFDGYSLYFFLTHQGDVFITGQSKDPGYFTELEDLSSPLRIESLTDIDTISVGDEGRSYYFIDKTKRLFVAGLNSYGELCVGNDSPCLKPVMIPGLSVNKVFPGYGFVMILTEDGLLHSGGSNHVGQLGHGHHNDLYSATLIPGLKDVKDVLIVGNFVCALTQTGQVYAWGVHRHDLLGLDSEDDKHSRPVLIKELINISKIVEVPGNIFFINTEGQVHAMGNNIFGRSGEYDPHRFPVLLPHLRHINKIFETHKDLLFSNQRDELYTYGEGHGLTVIPAGEERPALVLDFKHLMYVICCDDNTMFLTQDGTYYAWGSNERVELGLRKPSLKKPQAILFPPVAKVIRTASLGDLLFFSCGEDAAYKDYCYDQALTRIYRAKSVDDMLNVANTLNNPTWRGHPELTTILVGCNTLLKLINQPENIKQKDALTLAWAQLVTLYYRAAAPKRTRPADPEPRHVKKLLIALSDSRSRTLFSRLRQPSNYVRELLREVTYNPDALRVIASILLEQIRWPEPEQRKMKVEDSPEVEQLPAKKTKY